MLNLETPEYWNLDSKTRSRSDWSTWAKFCGGLWEISRLVVQQGSLLRGGVAEQRMELVIKENVAAIIRSGWLGIWIIDIGSYCGDPQTIYLRHLCYPPGMDDGAFGNFFYWYVITKLTFVPSNAHSVLPTNLPELIMESQAIVLVQNHRKFSI